MTKNGTSGRSSPATPRRCPLNIKTCVRYRRSTSSRCWWCRARPPAAAREHDDSGSTGWPFEIFMRDWWIRHARKPCCLSTDNPRYQANAAGSPQLHLMVITSRHQWARAASGRGYLTFLHIGHFVVRCGCTHRFADIESGAKTIREYQPGAMYGVLQTPATPGRLSNMPRRKARSPTSPSAWLRPASNAGALFSAQAARSSRR
jgi:hypothetical protein